MYEKLKNYWIQSSKECLSFVFCLFCFLLLSYNTLHKMFYTYICYWNIFQYKHMIKITFHVLKQSHVRVTSKDICLYFIFLCLFLFCLDFVLFKKKKSKNKKNVRENSFTHLRDFATFFFVCFHWKITSSQQSKQKS